MKTNILSGALVLAALAGVCSFPLPVGAAIQTAEQANQWAASTDAPLTFTIPPSQGPQIMEKAQVLIAEWSSIDSNDAAMELTVATNSVIEADSVTSQPGIYKVMQNTNPECRLGFSVVCSSTQDGDVISINTVYPLSQDSVSARRGHLLAYLLQQYGETLSTAPGNLETYMKDLRNQLDSGQYAAAAATIDALRADVVAKQTGQEAAPMPER